LNGSFTSSCLHIQISCVFGKEFFFGHVSELVDLTVEWCNTLIIEFVVSLNHFIVAFENSKAMVEFILSLLGFTVL